MPAAPDDSMSPSSSAAASSAAAPDATHALQYQPKGRRMSISLPHALLGAAAIVMGALALPWVPKGLAVPPGAAPLFTAVTAASVGIVFATIALRRRAFARMSPKRLWIVWVIL